MKPPYVKLYPSDLLAGAAFLPPEWRGAYAYLLVLQADRGAIDIPIEVLSEHLRLPRGDLLGLLQAKFEETPEGWVNQRMNRERTTAIELRQKQIEGGRKKGTTPEKPKGNDGKSNGDNDAERSPGGDLKVTSETRTRTRTREKSTPKSPQGGLDFERFWQAYPRKTAKADARKAWAKHSADRPPLDEILAAVQRQRATQQWREGVVPHAKTWINQHRWEDEVGTVATGPKLQIL